MTSPRKLPPALEKLDVKQRLELASRVLARRNLIHFVKRFYPSYEAGWVHEDIARRLEKFSDDVTHRRSPRLMLLMPPRHGKSELASIRFPAWHLGHHPEHEVINCGYNLDLPMKFSRKVREITRDPSFLALFPKCVLDAESQSAEAWNTTSGGGFTAAGVGGGIVGKGAHVLIIDDPIKNQEEADSILTRDMLWSWYWSTAYTRLAPGGGVLIIQTWWNDDDLAGRLQLAMAGTKFSEGEDRPTGDQFDVVKYPALAEEYEYLNKVTNKIERYKESQNLNSITSLEFLRAPGEALHSARYDEKMLVNYRANMPRRTWSALYQQNPVPDEGMYFQKAWMKFETQSPPLFNRNVYQAWDFAIGEKQHNDYNVGVTLLQDEQDYLHLVDVVRFRGDSFTIVEEILNAVEKWGNEPTCPLVLGFEDGQIWKAVKPLLSARMQERKLYPSYEELKTLTDKMARARSLQGRMQQGRVWFPLEAPWLANVQLEFLRFPAGAHDDVVDALAHAVNLCVNKTPKESMYKIRAPKSWKEKLNNLIGGGEGSHMSA
jgi:predicted phage terminase large subunit-like protein